MNGINDGIKKNSKILGSQTKLKMNAFRMVSSILMTTNEKFFGHFYIAI